MMTINNELSAEDLHHEANLRLESVFETYLLDVPCLELKAAMKHSLLKGGKRLRPLLVYATGSLFSANPANLDIAAAAVEMIHTYSLIHDDLPAMDDADIRRGQPSCHKAFDEATAILAGDGLLTLAMQIIASHPAPLSAEKRLAMLALISEASGPYGMVAGQALDITALSDPDISQDLLKQIYRLKTGTLLSSCTKMAWLASDSDDEFDKNALTKFGDSIGLAFQIQDDILDIESSTNMLGKEQGIDIKNNKMTYPKVVGINKAKQKVESLYNECLEAINHFGKRAHLLRQLTTTMLERKR